MNVCWWLISMLLLTEIMCSFCKTSGLPDHLGHSLLLYVSLGDVWTLREHLRYSLSRPYALKNWVFPKLIHVWQILLLLQQEGISQGTGPLWEQDSCQALQCHPRTKRLCMSKSVSEAFGKIGFIPWIPFHLFQVSWTVRLGDLSP